LKVLAVKWETDQGIQKISLSSTARQNGVPMLVKRITLYKGTFNVLWDNPDGNDIQTSIPMHRVVCWESEEDR